MLLLQSLQALQSDVLVTTRAELHVAAARFAPSQVTLVAQEHMHYFQRSQKVRHSVDECIGRIAALVVLTEGDRHDYLQESPWPRSKVSVIPNAVRGTLLSPVVQREKLIVAAGRLTEQKGFDRLIDAYAPIARSHPDWRLHIFGKGPDRRKLQRRINDHGISQQIRLKGWEDRLDLVFNRAAVLALASRYEGLPLVIIEAMAQGLPVISFNCPTGPRDLVRHGETGFLVPNGDIDAFSRALKRLINNADLRESMGEAARTDARRYHLSTVGQQWDSLLDTLLMARSTASPRRAGGRENLGGKPLWAARRVRAARSEGVRV